MEQPEGAPQAKGPAPMSWASAAAATAAPAPGTTSAAPIATAAPAAPAEPLPPPLREGESNWSLFVKGVHYAIDLWTIIELALAHGFGGKNTAQKVQTLEFEIRPSSFHIFEEMA